MGPVRSPTLPRHLGALVVVALVGSACDARRIVGKEIPLCERCHGGNGSAAPPRSARGATDTSDRGVGAHARHLALQGDDVLGPLACEECHDVPTSVDAHLDGAVPVRLLPSRGATARWDRATGRCADVSCHGAALRDGSRGTATAPEWTRVDGAQMACGACHAAPPASHAVYEEPATCHRCHAGTVKADGTIDLASGQHLDGTTPVPAACDACHLAPPDTGAHRAHANPADPSAVAYGGLAVLEDVAPGGGSSYDFGCGHCHPVDPARHADGTRQVDLVPPATPVAGDELKARNDPAAAFDPAGGTCSGVACHSSGQATPAYVATPAWTAAPGALGCGGCHGNPPQYPSGGAGAADANSHLDLDLEQDWTTGEWLPSWEFGHFAGLPGPDHTSKHGGGDPLTWGEGHRASPITCQACHFETVDPSKVRTGGFFYFDPGGDYDLRPAGLAGREASSSWRAAQCATCHLDELGSGGRVLPLRHVNGKRDVTFDRRAALPTGYDAGLPPLATGDPVRPYYMTTSGGATLTLTTGDCVSAPAPSCGVAADVVMRQTLEPGDPVLTLTLEHASWDPATKTCSAVACHLDRQQQVESGAQPPLRWGAPYLFYGDTCTACHAL